MRNAKLSYLERWVLRLIERLARLLVALAATRQDREARLVLSSMISDLKDKE